MVDKKKSDDTAKQAKSMVAEFGIESVYLKKLHVDIPKPAFTYKGKWEPQAKVALDSKHQSLGDTHYDVLMTVTVKVEMNDEAVFEVVCETGGVFHAKDFPEAQLNEVLKTHCLNIIFPFARQTISDAIVKAGFPVLHINPIDFHAQYRQHQEQQAKTADKSAGEVQGNS
jgi:preprotein translocase subunit SecB